MSTKTLARNRAIHLIDIENQLGTPFCEPSAIALWMEDYMVSFVTGPNDLVVIGATSTECLFSIDRSGVCGRHLYLPGPDGADRALLEVMREERLEARFEKLFCASGDGIFAAEVSRLARLGMNTTVISRPERLAKTLLIAAHNVILTTEEQHRDAA